MACLRLVIFALSVSQVDGIKLFENKPDGRAPVVPLEYRLKRQVPSEINIQVTAPLFTARLFDFGPSEGDTAVPTTTKDVTVPIVLQSPIQFYAKQYNRAYIHSNGGITFTSTNPSASSRGSVLLGKYSLIAPFWNRNDLRKGGNVFYREVTEGRLIERAKSEVLYQYERSVSISSVLVVTWHLMQPADGEKLPDDNTNTFQVVLIKSGNETFANFIYKSIGWTQGAEAGFCSDAEGKHFALPTSGTEDVKFLKEYGNTGIPGEWMFQVDWHRVVRCKAGVKGDTCDAECSSNEWGEDCEHCCFCMHGRCNAITGECEGNECQQCWHNLPYCNTYNSSCTPSLTLKCPLNAVSVVTYDKCGKPTVSCHCLAGYKGDGKTCTDMDECQADHECDENADCVNVPGSYFCQCRSGYFGNGTYCTKVATTEVLETSTVVTTVESRTEISSAIMQPMGFTEDREVLPRRTNSHVSYSLKQPMTIFGHRRGKLTVSSNGLVTVNGVLPVSAKDSLEIAGVHGFAPYYNAIDLSRSSGSVSVQETSSTDMLTEASMMIGRHYPSLDFMAQSIVMVAYENVSTSQFPDLRNTFLLVLVNGVSAKGEQMTFADFVYEEMNSSEGAEACIISSKPDEVLRLPGSGTDGVRLLSHLSNINEPGQWLFRVDQENLQFCSSANLRPPYCETGEEVTEALSTALSEVELETKETVGSSTVVSESANSETAANAANTLLIHPAVLRVQLVTQPTASKTDFAAAKGVSQESVPSNAYTEKHSTPSMPPYETTRNLEFQHSLTTSRWPLLGQSPKQVTTVIPAITRPIEPVGIPYSKDPSYPKKKPVSAFSSSTGVVRLDDDEESLDSSSQLAIIIPAAIVGIWLLLLSTIGLAVCFRRKLSKRRFRRTYEANYHFQPIGAGSLASGKRGIVMVPSRASYESVLTDYSSSSDRKHPLREFAYNNNSKSLQVNSNGRPLSHRNNGAYNYFNQSYYNSQPELNTVPEMPNCSSRIRVSSTAGIRSRAKPSNNGKNRSVRGQQLSNSNRVLADTLQKARSELKRLKSKVALLKKEGMELKIHLFNLNVFCNQYALLEQPDREAQAFRKFTEQLKVALDLSLAQEKEVRSALKVRRFVRIYCSAPHVAFQVSLTARWCRVRTDLLSELLETMFENNHTLPSLESNVDVSVNCVSIEYPGPFKCPICDRTLLRAIKLCSHCEEVHGVSDVRFHCQICKRVGTIFSTSVHYDRCKSAQKKAKECPPEEGDFHCDAENCSRSFSTFTGLRLHLKRAHPEDFAATKKPICNQRWDDEEKRLLAKLDIKFSKRCLPERQLCKLLAEKLVSYGGKQRSSESVKGQRRKLEHKTLHRMMLQRSRRSDHRTYYGHNFVDAAHRIFISFVRFCPWLLNKTHSTSQQPC
uniref:EGF-like domain-containing protein n=1 Tax=Trichuris muris TaxID=70415 RepID=A0A5S6QS67_TRIMR